VQFALQKGHLASLWQLASSVLSLGALIAVVVVKGSLAWLTLAVFGAPVLVNLVNAIVFWVNVRPAERPSYRFFQREQAAFILRVGMLFFGLQLASSFAFASDNLIIAQVLGQPAVAQYAIVARLFEGLIILLSMFITPLWPAYAEASARGDSIWIRKAFMRSMQGTVIIMMFGAALLAVVSAPLTEYWVGSAAGYSLSLVVAYGIWIIFKGVGSTLGAFLNGMNFLRSQAVLALLFAAASVLTKLEFARNFGLVGVPLALSLTYVAVVLLPFGVILHRNFERS
jgi:O-antigen/teichoic acid export membrane protein